MTHSRFRFWFLSFIFVVLIPLSAAGTQRQALKKAIQAELGDVHTVFERGGLRSLILNTEGFKKPGRLEERVILLINQRIYSVLSTRVKRFIQDLFDEGIDVRAVLMDSDQMQSAPAEWKEDAGQRLKFMISELYDRFEMGKIPSRDRRGLILLGAFPADFISWQQAGWWPGVPEWAAPRAVNDFRRGVIRLQWNSYTAAPVEKYVITVHHVPKPNKPNEREPLKDENNDDVEDIDVAPSMDRLTRYEYTPPFEGQKNIQFEIKAKLRNGTFSIPAFSNIVNWNFLINPSDYVLADIDGFGTRTIHVLKYQEGGRFFGIKTKPVLVVTDGVAANPQGLELSSSDWAAGRSYAQCEMYFGRIDAQSLTVDWKGPASIEHRNEHNPLRLNTIEAGEIRFIREYLDRNHAWRKDKDYRDRYDGVYFFRSSDFVNPVDEKNRLAGLWRPIRGIRRVEVDDAKAHVAAACSDTTKGELRLSSGLDHEGQEVGITADTRDLSSIFTRPQIRPQSLRYISNGGAGCAVLYSGKNFTGDEETIRADDGDLGDNTVGVRMQSVRFFCFDEVGSLKEKPIVRLYDRTGYGGFLAEINKDYLRLSEKAADNRVASFRLDRSNNRGSVVFYSEERHEGRLSFFTADDPDLSDDNVGIDAASSVKVWDCIQTNSPSWDYKGHLYDRLRKPWRLLDLGIHGNFFGAKYGDGLMAGQRFRNWNDRILDTRFIWNLAGDVKFFINHCCENGQFMAPFNAGTMYLFRNKMLAEWCWAGSGTTEHDVLHERLRSGDRFGAAVLANSETQMSPAGANPWRSYFTAVLGDPTLRVFYRFPDLSIKDISLPKEIWENRPVEFTVTVGNVGELDVDQPLTTLLRWNVREVARETVVTGGAATLRPLVSGKEVTLSGSIEERLPAGRYFLTVTADPDDIISEADENNNVMETPFVLREERDRPEQKPRSSPGTRITFYGGGIKGKWDDPLFIEGEPNGEAARAEYPDWKDYQTVDSTSLKAGLSLEHLISPGLMFSWGIDYSRYLMRVEKPGGVDYFDESALEVLNIPLLLKLVFGSKRFSFYFGGGMEGSYYLSMKHHYHWQSGELIYDRHFGSDAAEFGEKMVQLLSTRIGYSAVGLAGIRMAPFAVEARYYAGLNDIILDLSETAYREQINAGKLKGILLLLGLSF